MPLIAIDCHTSECRPVSLDEQLAVAKAAQALRLHSHELLTALAALRTLQPPPDKERLTERPIQRLTGWSGREREAAPPVFLPGPSHTVSCDLPGSPLIALDGS